MKNQKGITLVSLVITIIVLVMLAGVAIVALMGDNSVLRQANSARVTNLESTVNEEVKLACAALRIAVAEAQAKNNSYSVIDNEAEISATLKRVLNDDTNLSGAYEVSAADANHKIVITYKGNDYSQATNDNEAAITFEVQLAQSTIELVKDSMDASGLVNQIGGKEAITVDEITKTPGTSTETPSGN